MSTALHYVRQKNAATLAHAVFAELAPGITPGYNDWLELDKLTLWLARQNVTGQKMTFDCCIDSHESVIAHAGEPVDFIRVNDFFGNPLAECWIENNSTPSAFFYWES